MATTQTRQFGRVAEDSVPRMSWSGIQFSVEKITPELSERFLEKNTLNRRIKKGHLDSLIRAMVLDQWMFTSMPIAFSKEGHMINGQHTLMAIIESEKPQWCLVVRGLDPEVRFAFDDGAKLSFGDCVKMQEPGTSQEKTVAAVVRRVKLFESGRMYFDGNTTYRNTELDLALSQHPGIYSAVESTNRPGLTKRGPQSLWAFLWYITQQIDEAASTEFFHKVETGVGLEEKSPILALRNFLDDVYRVETKSQQRRKGIRPTHPTLLRYMVKSWNLYRAGKPVSILRIGNNENPVLRADR